jgi:hypothetical protein
MAGEHPSELEAPQGRLCSGEVTLSHAKSEFFSSFLIES